MPENPLARLGPRFAVVVSSCDAFFDAWQPFAFFFRKHWPDCPWPVFLIVNELDVRSDWLRPIRVGPDRGWTENLRVALGGIDADYVLYFQEDYFLTGPVNAARLAADCALCLDRGVDHLCLKELPLPEVAGWPRVEGRDDLAVIPAEAPWRTRLQLALWRRTALLDALQPGESAWDFEARGSARTRDTLAMTYTEAGDAPLPYLASAIVRSLWTPAALRLCAENGVPLTPRFRSEYSTSSTHLQTAAHARPAAVSLRLSPPARAARSALRVMRPARDSGRGSYLRRLRIDHRLIGEEPLVAAASLENRDRRAAGVLAGGIKLRGIAGRDFRAAVHSRDDRFPAAPDAARFGLVRGVSSSCWRDRS